MIATLAFINLVLSFLNFSNYLSAWVKVAKKTFEITFAVPYKVYLQIKKYKFLVILGWYVLQIRHYGLNHSFVVVVLRVNHSHLSDVLFFIIKEIMSFHFPGLD